MIFDIVGHHCSMNDVFKLLRQSHPCPDISPSLFHSIVHSLPSSQKIFVYTDVTGAVAGIITIMIEQRLSHGGHCVAHITDLEVDNENAERGIAFELVNYAVEYATRNKCVRVVAVPSPNSRADYINNYFTAVDGLYVRKTNVRL